MSAPRLKVGGLDLSEFLRTQPDESPAADPAGSGYFRPQFSGAPALGEGQSFSGVAVDNRTMVFPLYIAGPALTTRALIKSKIEEINEVLVKGAQVEFCIDPSVESSSYFDLEGGTLQEEFNFYHLINMVSGAVLTLTVRPYANTATQRLIASIPAATSAVVEFAATGIIGDAYGLANLEVRVGSQVASAGRVIAWGVHPSASHNPYQAATSGLAQPGATVRGASGAIGSQYTAIPVSPTGASGIAYTAYLEPVAAHVGRHRVIAIGRSALTVPIPLYAEDRFGAILGATAIASQTDVNKWQVIDLGEVNVPARASGQEAVPTQYVNIRGGGAEGAGINATPGFHLNGLLFLPLDYSAGILRTPGTLVLERDAFTRFPGGALLETLPEAEVDGKWSNAGGYAAVAAKYRALTAVSVALSPFAIAANATAFYDLASGALNSDVAASAEVFLGGVVPSQIASGAYAELWAKRSPESASAGVWTRLTFGPSQTLQLLAGNGTTATVLASAGIASTLASGLYQGQTNALVLKTQGALANVWLATGPLAASPILAANNSMISQAGNPAIRLQTAAASSAKGFNQTIFIDNIALSSLSAGASDIGARETFRFESHPEGRVYQGNASVFQQDRLANYRGQFPKLPPVGSPGPSGPARMVVLQGEIDNLQGLDGPDIAVTVLERYRFLS